MLERFHMPGVRLAVPKVVSIVAHDVMMIVGYPGRRLLASARVPRSRGRRPAGIYYL
jgi:hypothetical protein